MKKIKKLAIVSGVKVCPGADCGRLFIDETKNGRRKWCSMESCGNRAKASRRSARHKVAVDV